MTEKVKYHNGFDYTNNLGNLEVKTLTQEELNKFKDNELAETMLINDYLFKVDNIFGEIFDINIIKNLDSDASKFSIDQKIIDIINRISSIPNIEKYINNNKDIQLKILGLYNFLKLSPQEAKNYISSIYLLKIDTELVDIVDKIEYFQNNKEKLSNSEYENLRNDILYNIKLSEKIMKYSTINEINTSYEELKYYLKELEKLKNN